MLGVSRWGSVRVEKLTLMKHLLYAPHYSKLFIYH